MIINIIIINGISIMVAIITILAIIVIRVAIIITMVTRPAYLKVHHHFFSFFFLISGIAAFLSIFLLQLLFIHFFASRSFFFTIASFNLNSIIVSCDFHSFVFIFYSLINQISFTFLRIL